MRAALRATWMLLVVLALVAPGCSTPAPSPAPTPTPTPTPTPSGSLAILELDGRWSFSAAGAATLLEQAGLARPAGALLLGSAIARHGDEPLAVDFAGVDDGAARIMTNASAPTKGGAILDATFARAHGLRTGDALALRADAWEPPQVSVSFEMERTRRCTERPEAKLCILDDAPAGSVALQLRVAPGAQDVAFQPEAAELGPGGLPAWWNGSFTSPSGRVTPLAASMLDYATLRAAEERGPAEPGAWRIQFRTESNNTRYNGAAIGIVRAREPGYTWFDDRVLGATTTEEQSRLVLSWAKPRAAAITIRGLADALPAGIDVLVSLDDARALKAAPDDDASALLVPNAQGHDAKLATARGNATSGALASLILRAWPPNASEPARLLMRAPADIDITKLPAVPGIASVGLVISGRAPFGAGATIDGKPLSAGLRLLAPASEFPYAMSGASRWPSPRDAFDNVSRSRTLVLPSADLAAANVTASRIVLGNDPTGRVVVAVASVATGPPRALWTSASLVWGATQPEGALVAIALAPGADEDATMAAAARAWAPMGLARAG